MDVYLCVCVYVIGMRRLILNKLLIKLLEFKGIRKKSLEVTKGNS